MAQPYGGDYGMGAGMAGYGLRPNFYAPYVNQVYGPPMGYGAPPSNGGMGSGFAGRGRGALDWLIPPGFLGHVPNRNLFGRPIAGMQPMVPPAGPPVGPMIDNIYANTKNPPPMQGGLGNGLAPGLAPRYTMRDKLLGNRRSRLGNQKQRALR